MSIVLTVFDEAAETRSMPDRVTRLYIAHIFRRGHTGGRSKQAPYGEKFKRCGACRQSASFFLTLVRVRAHFRTWLKPEFVRCRAGARRYERST